MHRSALRRMRRREQHKRGHIPRRDPSEVIDSTDAPSRHLLAQLDAFAVAHVSLLLQVLRLRDPQGAPLRARRGLGDPRRRGQAAGEGAAGPDRRASRGQPAGARASERLWARGLHRVRGVDLRAGARAGALAAHESWGALARGPGSPARGNRFAGPDARVCFRAADADSPRGLAHQASGPSPGDDSRCRRASDPVHQRHPRGHWRDRRGAHCLAGSSGGGPGRAWPHPGGDPPELRAPPELLRAGARRDRRRGRTRVLAHRGG